jgi:hypothetical protein
VNSAKDRPATSVSHRDDHLRRTRTLEDDAVAGTAAVGDRLEFEMLR